MNNLLSELREVLLQKRMAFPNAGIWADSTSTTYFSNVITQTADWMCQNLFNIGKYTYFWKKCIKNSTAVFLIVLTNILF